MIIRPQYLYGLGIDWCKVNDENENNLESGSDNEDDVISFDEKEVFENKEEAPVSMELPKMKQEYTFKELDGESYRLNK